MQQATNRLTRVCSHVTTTIVKEEENSIDDYSQNEMINTMEISGIKGLFNKYIRQNATKLKNKVLKQKPRKVSALEAMFMWFTTTIISIPWLSVLLLCSFLKIRRKKQISMLNSWAYFLLTKIFKINLYLEAPFDYGPPPYTFVLLNQHSLLDTMLVLPAVLPNATEVFVFANYEFLLIPFVGWVFWKTLRSEMVIRQNPIQARSAVDRAAKRMIDSQSSVIISIEGKRSENGGLSPFKRGPALLAIKTQTTIIPIVVKGTKEIWPYGEWKIRVGGDVTVKLLEPIHTRGMTLDDRFIVSEKLQKIAQTELFTGSKNM